MSSEVRSLPITPRSELKEGDRFILFSDEPVLIKGLNGKVSYSGEFSTFYPDGQKRGFSVFQMTRKWWDPSTELFEQEMAGQLGCPEGDMSLQWRGWRTF